MINLLLLQGRGKITTSTVAGYYGSWIRRRVFNKSLTTSFMGRQCLPAFITHCVLKQWQPDSHVGVVPYNEPRPSASFPINNP